MAGEWQQIQLWNGDYCLDDLLDWHEMDLVRRENSRRARQAAERAAEQKANG